MFLLLSAVSHDYRIECIDSSVLTSLEFVDGIKPVNGVVDIDAYLNVLAEVKAKVDVAVVALKAFVGVKADVLLLHDGKLIDLHVCAKIVVDAIVVSFDGFWFYFKLSCSLNNSSLLLLC